MIIVLILMLCACLTGCAAYDVSYSHTAAVNAEFYDEENNAVNEAYDNEQLYLIAYDNGELIDVVSDSSPLSFMLPITNYRKTSSFGPRWGRQHKGVDLAVEEGTDVTASCSGIVYAVNEGNSGYGNYVLIYHGEINGKVYCTRYAHLSGFADIKVGDHVQQGDIIAYSGNTGNSTGPHLHFEIIIDNVNVDPEEYVKF